MQPVLDLNPARVLYLAKIYVSLCHARAEVTCRDAIRQARVTRVKSKGLQALASVNLKRSESGAHRVFRQFGQSLPVKISRVDLPTKQRLPFLKCSDWLKYLASTDRLDLVVGVKDIDTMRPLLLEFWDRYFEIAPSHPIYEKHLEGLLDVPLTIPLLHHGDEGRGFKRQQVMVASTHGVLGNGCRLTDSEKLKPSSPGALDDPMKINMVGNTWLTHFCHFVMPVALYKESPESFLQMLDELSRDYRKLFSEGFKTGHRDEKLWACVIACKGDSPYIVKAGCFERSFYRRPLKATSKTAAAGICHRCLAGKEDHVPRVEYEEFGPRPAWMATEFLLKPWEERPPFLSIPREIDNPNGEKFFQFDLFHNFHLGCGKYFAASALVLLTQAFITGSSIDQKFRTSTTYFQAFCKQKNLHPYYKNLTKEMFGIVQNHNACPTGGWPKGDQTTIMCLFLQDLCTKMLDEDVTDEMFIKLVSC